LTETIAAISTPLGEGALAVLRVSGPEAVRIAGEIFRGKLPAARTVSHGTIHDGAAKLDDVLLTVFRAPRSYTGEDVVELSCHGGVLVARRIYELLLRRGARAAEPGEFTQRAFLHGKLDLTQAEAVMDLISAQTDLALRAANEQLEGRLGARLRDLRAALLEVLAHVEAFIDFPDEDIDPETGGALLARLEAVWDETGRLLATAAQGRVLREGVRTVISGAPNVGKSSLLNRLLGYERAIVHERAGTTRDVLEEVINLRGLPIRLIDTAGLRDAADEIERAGIARARRELARADLVLHVEDASTAPSCLAKQAALLVLNKCDLAEHPAWQGVEAVRISCATGQGLEELAAAIERRVLGGAAHPDWTIAINARHQACLERARTFLEAARRAFADDLSAEFIAEEVRAALDAIGEIVGQTDTEDLFSRFCIGK
jgi:tRNA modification GTPase